jgi:uncharacterized protein YlxW (UPF0749 family)
VAAELREQLAAALAAAAELRAQLAALRSEYAKLKEERERETETEREREREELEDCRELLSLKSSTLNNLQIEARELQVQGASVVTTVTGATLYRRSLHSCPS